MNAFCLVHPDSKEGNRLKEGINGAQGAKKAAKRAVNKNACEQDHDKKCHLPGKKGADEASKVLLQKRQGKSCFQRTRRTHVFAKSGR